MGVWNEDNASLKAAQSLVVTRAGTKIKSVMIGFVNSTTVYELAKESTQENKLSLITDVKTVVGIKTSVIDIVECVSVGTSKKMLLFFARTVIDWHTLEN
jgi:hypothetical protein